ncbi:DNA polymerase I [Helicobacter bilis]|uniref:DNA polymerase I n=1 Tax=Helicobacter bilis TaxID=37372 RepID=UPI0026EB26C3|nr:DNA polymerase I [Helicobacter bilis]MCI7411467.1 DNA polymerase I [Helicobacter bilis]MDD7296724.1 DNA polymerase I [Helicobacter bilis]MDY4400404.1 DNA polymerase I [Helicobacter bilis]
MQSNLSKVILVDTFGFFFRSYYALPPLHNSKHFPTSLLTGFATLIFNLYKEHKDSCIIFTLEGGGTNRRKEFYPQYKANRKEAPQDLLAQLPVAIEWLEKMGLPTLSLQGYEADDCIATLATLAKKDGYETQIISHDKDLYQLISEGIYIFDYAKKQAITQKECYEKFGVLPNDFIMYQSIVGDSSDNVPGIKGIGPKGAQSILAHFKSLESLYENIEKDYENIVSLLGKRTVGLIKEHKEQAFISRNLVTLRTDLLQNYDFLSKKNEFETSPLLTIKDELESYELHRILQKILPRRKNNTQYVETIPLGDIGANPFEQRAGFRSQDSGDSKENASQSPTPTQVVKNLDSISCHTEPLGEVSNMKAKSDISTSSQYDNHLDSINYALNLVAHPNLDWNLDSKNTPHNLAFQYTPHLITDSKELFNLLESIPKGNLVAFDCETNGLDVREADMVGFSFCFDGLNAYYVPFLHGGIKREKSKYEVMKSQSISQNLFSTEEAKPTFSLFDDTTMSKDSADNDTTNAPAQISQSDAKKALEILFSYPLIGHNIKFDLHIAWHNFGIKPKHIPQDSMLLAWLDDPSQSVSLDNLMKKHFNHNMIAFSDIVPKKATFDSIDIKTASNYAAEDAAATFQLYFHFKNTLYPHLFTLAKDLEFPFIRTLCAMEDCGIAINYSYFKNLKTTFSHTLQQLQQEIYEKAGVSFNLNSPKQVAEILFDTLKLDAKRKGKSGYSTDEATLLALKDSHPVVPLLLEYREIFKLFSTYIEPILKLGKNENRIYTTFLQTGTNTGRLSSKSPNLQNIPVRSEMGRSIRKGFVSRDGYKLLSLDYSQIELRLLAHFSGDKVLLESFHNNADIHAETAKLLFKDSNKDFSLLRSIAKSINFGLIYGMGARKLSQTLNITQTEARQYIEDYFATFPSVKQFLESQKDSILKNGYSTTLLGRKRYFDFFSATEFMRANFLREGVNTIFQGSAADLIKLSMNEIYKKIESLHNDCFMLLQVHDELIFEVKNSIIESLSKELKEIMENIYKLKVPLVCNLSIGNTWAELK